MSRRNVSSAAGQLPLSLPHACSARKIRFWLVRAARPQTGPADNTYSSSSYRRARSDSAFSRTAAARAQLRNAEDFDSSSAQAEAASARLTQISESEPDHVRGCNSDRSLAPKGLSGPNRSSNDSVMTWGPAMTIFASARCRRSSVAHFPSVTVSRVSSASAPKRSTTCITTNRLFKDWPKVFPNALNAQVIAERLTERAKRFVFDEKGLSHHEARNLISPLAPPAGCPVVLATSGDAAAHAVAHRGQGEEPSACHRPGPWLPVIPVNLVPGVASGDSSVMGTNLR
jgi:hypothetical protein